MDERFTQALAQGQRLAAHYTLARAEQAPLGQMGAQFGHRPGSSLEFMDHRDYQPGDDLRRIDWAAYARSDRLTVKLFREEVSPHLDVALDGSRSMDLPETDKARGAAALTALLTSAAESAGYSHRVHLTAGGFEPVPGSEARPEAWRNLRFEASHAPAEAFARMPPRWKARGVRVLISDLLWPGEPLPFLRRLSEGAAALHVVQLLAEADQTPPQRGNLRLVDSEDGQTRDIYIDAAAQQRYQRMLERQQQHWQAACRQIGAPLSTVIAEDVLAGDLTPLLNAGLVTLA
jgi:uncharacterized protein (DUF58 family)